MDEREATLKQISAKAIQETEKLAGTQRFALFSSPIPLALGDNSYDNKPRRFIFIFISRPQEWIRQTSYRTAQLQSEEHSLRESEIILLLSA